MSWWVHLVGPSAVPDQDGEGVVVERHSEGRTYALGGTNTAELNVTYNYGKHFRFEETLHENKASEVTPILEEAVQRLGTKRDSDYWNPTPGNVGYACSILLAWAKQHPDAVFRVS